MSERAWVRMPVVGLPESAERLLGFARIAVGQDDQPPAGIFSGSTLLRSTDASGPVSSRASIAPSTCSALRRHRLTPTAAAARSAPAAVQTSARPPAPRRAAFASSPAARAGTSPPWSNPDRCVAPDLEGAGESGNQLHSRLTDAGRALSPGCNDRPDARLSARARRSSRSCPGAPVPRCLEPAFAR